MKKDEAASVVPVRPGDAKKTSYGSSGSTNKSSAELSTPTDGGWGWAVVFAAFMINFVAWGITYTFGIFIIELTATFEEGRGTVSLIPAILSGVTLGVGPIVAPLVSYFGCCTVSIAGAILAAAGLAISALAPNVLTFYFTVGLCTGLGFGQMFLPAAVSVSMYFEKRRAFANGIAFCGSGIGTSFMAPLLHYLIDRYSWDNTLVILGAIVLLCAPLCALFKSVPGNNSAGNIEWKMIDVSLMGNGIFQVFALCSVLISIGIYVPYVYTVDRAIRIGIEHKNGSFLLSIIGIGNTLGRIVLGYISDWPCLNRLYIYNILLAICGLSIGISNFCTSFTSQAVYCAVFGATAGAWVSLSPVVLTDLIGLNKLASAFGLFSLCEGIGSIIGPPIVGTLYDTIGNYETGFYFSGSLICISGIMLFVLPWMERNRSAKKCQDKDSKEPKLSFMRWTDWKGLN